MDISKIRKDFPILTRKMSDKPLVYLDNGATTLKPQPVIDAVVNYYTYLGANAHRGDYEMSAQSMRLLKGSCSYSKILKCETQRRNRIYFRFE